MGRLLTLARHHPHRVFRLPRRRRLGCILSTSVMFHLLRLCFLLMPLLDAFHNSSRKTLSYVPPTVQNGKVIVRPSLDIIRSGSQRWSNTAVGYFLGRRPYFHHVNEFVRSVWPMVREVTATSNGFFFFQFKMNAAMEEVIEGGPWLFQGQPIVLQKWEPGMVLRKLQHTQVPCGSNCVICS
ncbi:UNVERIFIED_CONTAM: hypothetical protein Slati_2205100 [Sesamum latifolium]|uniref:DUF4283 domain-containing protein n=1 Tax=Sesamum latifolium TaxID=2727402 RepID=A0AAW2WV55_9LAMI